MRRFVWLLAGMALIAVLFSVALAKDDNAGKGPRGGQERRGGPPVVFGEITALGENSMTVKPELPPQMKERMTERRKQNGREMPKLPDSIKIKLGPDTKWYFDGAEGSRRDFVVGDTVVVKMPRGKNAKQPIAEAVADPETAKQYFMEKMQERRGQGQGPSGNQGGRQGRGEGEGRGRGDGPGGWGQGGPGGDQGYGPGPGGTGGDQGYGPGPGGPGGPGMGPGGPGGPGMGNGGPGGPGMAQGGPGGHRPMFGAVISVDRDSVTIRPDVPDFVAKMMKEHDMPVPRDLPDSVTLPLDEFTVFINRGEKVNKNPYVKGERVAIMMGRDDNDQPVARAIVDLMTAKAKIEKMMEKRGGEGGERGRGGRQGNRQGEQRDRGASRSERRNPK